MNSWMCAAFAASITSSATRRAAVVDVVENRVVEEHRVLRHDAIAARRDDCVTPWMSVPLTVMRPALTS